MLPSPFPPQCRDRKYQDLLSAPEEQACCRTPSATPEPGAASKASVADTWWVSAALRHICKCKRVFPCFNSVWFGSAGKLFNEAICNCYCRVTFSTGWRHAGAKAWMHLQREMCQFPRCEGYPAECHPCPDWLLHLLQLPQGRHEVNHSIYRNSLRWFPDQRRQECLVFYRWWHWWPVIAWFWCLRGCQVSQDFFPASNFYIVYSALIVS